MASLTEARGRPNTVIQQIHGRGLTLRQISEIYGIKYNTVRERYYVEGRRGLQLVDRTRRGDYDSDEDFIRACALRGHSQKYARMKLGWSIKQWYAILELLGPIEWLPPAQTIENMDARAAYAATCAQERSENTRLHYRCVLCGTRQVHTLDFVAEGMDCEECKGRLRLDKQATARAWGFEKDRGL